MEITGPTDRKMVINALNRWVFGHNKLIVFSGSQSSHGLCKSVLALTRASMQRGLRRACGTGWPLFSPVLCCLGLA